MHWVFTVFMFLSIDVNRREQGTDNRPQGLCTGGDSKYMSVSKHISSVQTQVLHPPHRHEIDVHLYGAILL